MGAPHLSTAGSPRDRVRDGIASCISPAGKMSGALISVIALAASASGGSASAPARAGLDGYLAAMGFSRSETVAVRGGSVVARVLPCADDNAAFVVGVVRIRGPEEELVDEVRRVSGSNTDGRVLQSGRFRVPPAIEDLSSLTIDAKELDDLRECRAGDCEIKADDHLIGLARKIDGNARDARGESSRAIKEALAHRVAAYLERGAQGMPVYRDNKIPESTGSEFERLLEMSPHLVARNPAFYRFVLDFPRATVPGVESFVYWSKQRMRKPVVSLVHACVQTLDDPGGRRHFIALKHIYDSHYFLAYGEFLETLPAEEPGPGFYLVRSVRARIDPPRVFRGMLLGRIKRAIKKELSEELERTKQRLEAQGRRGPGARAVQPAFR